MNMRNVVKEEMDLAGDTRCEVPRRDASTPIHSSRLLLRIPEAADALGISRSKAYELVAAGVLPAISVGSSKRIPIAALEAWIQDQLKRE